MSQEESVRITTYMLRKNGPMPIWLRSQFFLCVQFMAVCEKMMFSTSQWPDLGGVAISDQLPTPSRN